MKKRIYIETTIPSFYYTLRKDASSIARMNWTRQWWSELAPDFALLTSPAVIAELRRGSRCPADVELPAPSQSE